MASGGRPPFGAGGWARFSASVMFQCPLVARTPRGHGGQAAPRRDAATQACPHAAPPRLEALPPHITSPCFRQGRSRQHPTATPCGHCRRPRGATQDGRGQPSSHAGPHALGRTSTGPGPPTLGGGASASPVPGGSVDRHRGLRGMLAIDPVSGPALMTHALVMYLGIKGCCSLSGTYLHGLSVTVRGYRLYNGHFNT